jgi:oligoendopeptidase F
MSQAQTGTAKTVPARSEVPIEYTWDAASVFPSDAAFNSELEALSAAVPELALYQGHLGDSPTALLAWFDRSENILARLCVRLCWHVLGSRYERPGRGCQA